MIARLLSPISERLGVLRSRFSVDLAAVGAAILLGALVGRDAGLLAAVALSLSVGALILYSRPSLALAMLFNGQVLYFFALSRVGMAPRSVLTASYFVSLLVAAGAGFVRRGTRLRLLSADVAGLAVLLWSVASWFVFTFGQEWASQKMLFLPFLGLGPYLVARMLPANDFDQFLNDLLLVGKIVCLLVAWELLTSRTAVVRLAAFSISGETVDNPILTGVTAGISLTVLYVKIATGQARINVLNAAWLGLFAYVGARAASRGAIVSTVCAVLVVHLVIGVRWRALAFLGSMAVAAVFIVASLPTYVTTFYSKTFVYSPIDSVTQRLSSWRFSIALFKSQPVLGVGFGGYATALPQLGRPPLPYPHNLLLETAAELGVVGLILLAVFLIPPTWRVFLDCRRARDLARRMWTWYVVLALATFTLVEAQFSGFSTAQTTLYVSIGLAATLASCAPRWDRLTSAPRGGRLR